MGRRQRVHVGDHEGDAPEPGRSVNAGRVAHHLDQRVTGGEEGQAKRRRVGVAHPDSVRKLLPDVTVLSG